MSVLWSASDPRKEHVSSNVMSILSTSFQSIRADIGLLRKEGAMPTRNEQQIAKFKAQAKSLLRSVKAGDTNALKTIQPFFTPINFKLTQAQLVVARLNHCSSWKELVSKTDWNVCSFCGKAEQQAHILIGGAGSRSQLSSENCVFICDECIDLCAQIKADKLDGVRRTDGVP